MLSIQKVIVLLDDFHYEALCEHFKTIKAELPLRLIQESRKMGITEKDSDELCKLIYKKAGAVEKRKFFQLAHHTFKLTAFLSRNYPSYLNSTIGRIERLVNTAKVNKAEQLAEIALDIAEKIEDYSTARPILQFLAQQAYIRERKSEAVRYLERNHINIESELALNSLYLYIRSNLHFKDKSVIDLVENEKHLSFFASLHHHTSFAVRILSRYGSCYSLHFLNDPRFYSEKTLAELNTIAEELEKNPYVVFPFSDDIELNVDYLRLKLLILQLPQEEMQKEASRLLQKKNTPLFWKNYLKAAEIAFLSIQISGIVSKYGRSYRKNWNEHLPEDIKQQLQLGRATCERILKNASWHEENMHMRHINMNNIYCCYLLMGSERDQKKVTELLEGLLFNYQQVAFHRLYDQLFATLIMAYFNLGEYQRVQECYKRYEKITSSSSKLPENDLTIKALYYAAQWLLSERKQYRDKLNTVYTETKKSAHLENPKQLIEDLKDYFKI